MKILYQGSPGAYSHLAAFEVYPDAEIIACKTFDECFSKAQQDKNLKIIIPESNKTTGNIGIEYLIFKYRLNIYAEHFHKIEHNLLGLPGSKITDIKNVLSHAQGLSQCSNFIKKNNFIENVRADTAGSAELISKNKKISDAAIASKLSAKIYKLDIIKSNIENEKGNTTRFLIMGKSVQQPEFKKEKYITSFLFKLKSKPAALYQSLGGFAINGVNLNKTSKLSRKKFIYFLLFSL